MSKKLYILILGLVIALIQFLGIPGSWKAPLTILSGLAVSALAFLLKQEEMRLVNSAPRQSDAYAENGIHANEVLHEEAA